MISIEQIQAWLSIATQVALLVGVLISIGIQLRTQINVRKVELATNSMKDRLIESTHQASGLAGEQRGREQERARAEQEGCSKAGCTKNQG